MADSNNRRQSSGYERLPIKLILPNQGKAKVVPTGGSPGKPFVTVDQEFRNRLRTETLAIREAIRPQVRRTEKAPVRVKLVPKAAAKTHRPNDLFSKADCPIIGAGRLGEIFIKATPSSLSRLAERVTQNTAAQAIKEISTIQVIEPITPKFRRKDIGSLDILRDSPRKKKGFLTQIRLFDFGSDKEQRKLTDDFYATCEENKLSVNQDGYTPGSHVYAVECQNVEDVEALSRTVGVRSVAPMPLLHTFRSNALNIQPFPDNLPQATQVEGDFAVVVVVDTGISSDIVPLATWVVGRESDVSPAYRNESHGTFVAGLICWGAQLNPQLAGLDTNPCGVFDFQVLPNSDPAVGDVVEFTEQEFLISLENALKLHADKYKVWNMSLGTNRVCVLDEFSPLAEQLDNLQEKYKVSFVISAGNYESVPLLDYPRRAQHLEMGRITSPADCVLGIAVGAISHVSYANNGPKQNHPSGFSRHGAGPNYIIKPDLVHYGGSCSKDFQQQSGIRSVAPTGSTIEDLGTSFSTALVSRTLAQVYHQITPSPSPVLARALLTHHSRDPRNNGRIPDGEENFFGFGLPAPVPYCLECTPYSSTLVFEDSLRPGFFLEWDDFPYPDSLKRNGRCFGEIWMTVAFAPARGARWGTEYCETHIDAHFGIYAPRTSRKTGEKSLRFKGLVPPEHKNPGLLYESYQVAQLRKWAPVRTYYGNLGEKGERGERWRLSVRLLTRHGIDKDKETFKPQPFSLIVTIADPEKKAAVYDEMAQVVRNRFAAENLTIRPSVRVETKR